MRRTPPRDQEQERSGRGDEHRSLELGKGRFQWKLRGEIVINRVKRRDHGQEQQTRERPERAHVHVAARRLDDVVTRSVELEMPRASPLTRSFSAQALIPGDEVSIVYGGERRATAPFEHFRKMFGIERQTAGLEQRQWLIDVRYRIPFVEHRQVRVVDDDQAEYEEQHGA